MEKKVQWNFTRLEKKQRQNKTKKKTNGRVIIWVEITEALAKDVRWRGRSTGMDKTSDHNKGSQAYF